MMYKISFKKEENTDDLFIYIHSKEKPDLTILENVAEDSLYYSPSDKATIIKIDSFFLNYLKKQNLKILLAQSEKPNFIIEYDWTNDEISFYYEKTEDHEKFESEQDCHLHKILYKIGNETILRININNFSEYLNDKEIKHEIFTEKLLIGEKEKETITYYLDVIKRYEENFKEENQEKLSKAWGYLKHIEKKFPLTSKNCIEAIEEQLKEFKVSELEECTVNLKEMESKIIYLDSLKKEPTKDVTEFYVNQYINHRPNLTSVFDDQQIANIPALRNQKSQELKIKLKRIRKILEVKEKYAPPKIQIQIKKYITVINNFEKKSYYFNIEEEKTTIDYLLDTIQEISSFFPKLNLIVNPIIGAIKAIKSLISLKDDYEKQKEERPKPFHLPNSQPYQKKLKKLRKLPRPTHIRRHEMIVKTVENVIHDYGRSHVHRISYIAEKYNCILDVAQIHTALSSNRFRWTGKHIKSPYTGRWCKVYGLNK